MTIVHATVACAILLVCLGAGDPPAKPDAPKQTDAPKPADVPKPAQTPTVVRPDNVLHCTAQTGIPREKLKFFGEEWNTELCLDEASRATGMGARTEFPPNTAMLFAYSKPDLLSFWMKDCLIDMDMVFVDAEGKISALHEAKRQPLRTRGQPLDAYESGLKRYGSNRRAKYCIELPAGTIKRLKPSLGQKIELDWASIDTRTK